MLVLLPQLCASVNRQSYSGVRRLGMSLPYFLCGLIIYSLTAVSLDNFEGHWVSDPSTSIRSLEEQAGYELDSESEAMYRASFENIWLCISALEFSIRSSTDKTFRNLPISGVSEGQLLIEDESGLSTVGFANNHIYTQDQEYRFPRLFFRRSQEADRCDT